MNGLHEKLKAAYKASGGRKVNLISHSMGGLLILCFISRHSDVSLSSLVTSLIMNFVSYPVRVLPSIKQKNVVLEN